MLKPKDLNNQLNEFIYILKKNTDLMDILDFVESLKLPNFYICAGAVFQTIWNYLDGKPLCSGIKDIDIIYYKDGCTKEDDDVVEKQILNYFNTKGYRYECDVHNEAIMHIWKKKNQNLDVKKYDNSEEAIDQWIATVHAVGITKDKEVVKVYAPYGLSDIFTKTVRPIIHSANSKELYENKVKKWQERFDGLTIIKWPNNF